MSEEQEVTGASAAADRATGPSDLSRCASSQSSVPSAGDMSQRIDDLRLALGFALDKLIQFEPPDSRAVSNEFVAMAAIHAGFDDRLDECRQIIRDAASAMSARSDETPQEAQSEGRQRDPKGDAQ